MHTGTWGGRQARDPPCPTPPPKCLERDLELGVAGRSGMGGLCISIPKGAPGLSWEGGRALKALLCGCSCLSLLP